MADPVSIGHLVLTVCISYRVPLWQLSLCGGETAGWEEAKIAGGLGKLTRAGEAEPMAWGGGCGKFHCSTGQCRGPQGQSPGLGRGRAEGLLGGLVLNQAGKSELQMESRKLSPAPRNGSATDTRQFRGLTPIFRRAQKKFQGATHYHSLGRWAGCQKGLS